jgi:hypothetical protein
VTTPREQLAAAIKKDLAAAKVPADVYDWGHQPDQLARPAVIVFRQEIDQGAGSLSHAFTVQVMGTQQYATRETEAALEALLDEVLISLRRLDVVAWTKATRKVFLELFHGWEIDVTWASADYYQQAI